MLEGAHAALQKPARLNALCDGCGRYKRCALTD